MITLTLLHPSKTEPVQNWTFDQASTIRIGRSIDNEVVLYSAVVSRHHLEIRREGQEWEVVSLGTNGTYVNGKLIKTARAVDGMIVHLAATGPKIQIRFPEQASSVSENLSQSRDFSTVSPREEAMKSSKTTSQEMLVKHYGIEHQKSEDET